MFNGTVIIGAIDYIGKSSWLSILAFIIGVIGVLYTIVSKKEKSPCYDITSNNIIRDFMGVFKQLEINYSNQEIKNFTVTKIVFWNKGRETIDKEDVVNADPISIHIKDGYNILDHDIIGKNEKTNNFSLSESSDKSSINIDFDYIDKNNGIVIQILHTGKSSEDIEFCGRMKGIGKTKRYDSNTLFV
jgi:predicted ATP-dependent endonuclease of OLD family